MGKSTLLFHSHDKETKVLVDVRLFFFPTSCLARKWWGCDQQRPGSLEEGMSQLWWWPGDKWEQEKWEGGDRWSTVDWNPGRRAGSLACFGLGHCLIQHTMLRCLITSESLDPFKLECSWTYLLDHILDHKGSPSARERRERLLWDTGSGDAQLGSHKSWPGGGQCLLSESGSWASAHPSPLASGQGGGEHQGPVQHHAGRSEECKVELLLLFQYIWAWIQIRSRLHKFPKSSWFWAPPARWVDVHAASFRLSLLWYLLPPCTFCLLHCWGPL